MSFDKSRGRVRKEYFRNILYEKGVQLTMREIETYKIR